MHRRTLIQTLAAVTARSAAGVSTERWAVYYSNRAPISAFQPFNTLILDSRYHPSLPLLATQGKKLIGYISAGEAAPDYSYFQMLKAQGLLLRPNPTWEGNYSIDIRDSRWLGRLRDEIVPSVLRRGFDGIFLDTIDTPLHLEETAKESFHGMADAAVHLIASLRAAYPRITIILNRGYKLLPRVAPHIDVAVAESLYTTYDFSRKVYIRVDPASYRLQLDWLRGALRERPELKIFTLDYWDPRDTEETKKIYRVERENGFFPYVTTIDLTNIVPEPV